MLVLAGICSGVYVMLSLTSVMRFPPALCLQSCLKCCVVVELRCFVRFLQFSFLYGGYIYFVLV